MEIDIDKIRSSPFQPRLVFDVKDLKEEIQKDGLLSPLLVREVDGYYELIDGERRLRAVKELGWKKVPVEVRKIDDGVARLSTYKLNKIRENYSDEEEARYFKKLADEGMKPYQIETELRVDHHWVQACLNIWKFPEDIRENIFGSRPNVPYRLYMTDVRDLETVINRNIDEAIVITKEIIDRRMTLDEKRELIRRRQKKVNEETIQKAEEVISAVAPTIKKPETPEELEQVAQALKNEAVRLRLEGLTPEDKAEQEAERRRRLEAQRKEAEERKRREEAERLRREEETKRRIEEEANRRAREIAESERRRIEEEARTRARKQVEIERSQLEKEIRNKMREELMHDQEFRRQVAETVTIPRREPKEELAVKEGTVYTIGELDCDRCKKHYVIKCDGKRNWLE